MHNLWNNSVRDRGFVCKLCADFDFTSCSLERELSLKASSKRRYMSWQMVVCSFLHGKKQHVSQFVVYVRFFASLSQHVFVGPRGLCTIWRCCRSGIYSTRAYARDCSNLSFICWMRGNACNFLKLSCSGLMMKTVVGYYRSPGFKQSMDQITGDASADLWCLSFSFCFGLWLFQW